MSQTQATPAPDVDERDKGQAGVSRVSDGKGDGRGSLLGRVVLLVIVTIWTIPTLGLLVSSFRTEDAVQSTGWWTAIASPLDFTQWTLENYHDVLFGSGMANAFLNTLVVAIPATVIPIAAAAFAAYAFSWMRFKGREVLFVLLIALLVVPLQVAFIPLLRAFGSLGLNGTFLAVWLAHTGFGMPLAVYLLRNYMGQLPVEVIESAEVDGASHWQIFWRLMIPLSTPVLAAYCILQFLWVWNDLLIALIFLGARQENQVLQQVMTSLIDSRGQDWHLLTAGGFITISVPLIVFFSLQRYFVRGLTAGSVKG
jgi:alpha-glucoside transport system permease protein